MKRISMIACVSATGESLIIDIVISQNSSLVQEQLWLLSRLYQNRFLTVLASLRDLAAFAEEVFVLLLKQGCAFWLLHHIQLRASRSLT
jgi:ABC-type dipeptide/oligopeptide/nickel transport system ATPase subunit